MQQTTFAEITPADSLIEVPDGFLGNTEDCPDGQVDACFRVPTSIGTLLTSNVGEAEISGLEVEIDWRPYDTGRVTGWVSYLNAEITELEGSVDGFYCFERAFLGLTPCAAESDNEFDDLGNPLRRTSFVGNQLPWSPEWSLTLNYEHNWYLENGLRISPYVSVNWQDEIFFDNNNFDEGAFHSGQPAYASASAAIRIINEEEKWGIEAFVNNITDERIRYWGDGGPGFLRSSFAPPRTYGLKFNVNF